LLPTKSKEKRKNIKAQTKRKIFNSTKI